MLNSVCPGEMEQILAHAGKQRYDKTADEAGKDYILVTNEWQQALEKHPFSSVSSTIYLTFFIKSKKGKAVHLLKQRAKTFRIVKPRVQYDYLGPGKRMKMPDGTTKNVAQAPAMSSTSAVQQRAKNKIKPTVTEAFMENKE